MKPTIVVAGLGETGEELIRRLALNWAVVGIDLAPGVIGRLEDRFHDHDDVSLHAGDATSALVLRRAGVEGAHAVVTSTGSDEVNLETLRLARELFEIENRFALMYSLEWEGPYRDEGVEHMSQDLACASILESRVERGKKVATGVGLGEGEIVEVEVLENSSVIGRTLAELSPRRWLVGAVYRDGGLIVPHGETVIEPGDHVLVIGDPVLLPSIATLIRSGESEFPLQFGSRLVGLWSRDIEGLLPEAAYLIENTRVTDFEVISCDADQTQLTSLAESCDRESISYRFSCSAEDTLGSLVFTAVQRDIGMLVLPPEPLSLWSRIGLGRSRTGRLTDLVNSPVLIARGTFPYKRVMLVLAELPFGSLAGQVAIDLVRMLDAELLLGVFHQPDLVAGADLRREVTERRRGIENLAGMYHVELQTRVFEGNPIHEVLRASEDVDLLVISHARNKRTFLTRPDITLNILHRAACSVVVTPQ